MVDGEVGLHGAKLMMLEAGPHSLGAGSGAQGAAASEPHLQVFGIQIWYEKRTVMLLNTKHRRVYYITCRVSAALRFKFAST